MMVVHHRGAIRKARVERGKGRDAQRRRLAREIISAQTAEIRDMTTWRSRWYGSASLSSGVQAT